MPYHFLSHCSDTVPLYEIECSLRAYIVLHLHLSMVSANVVLLWKKSAIHRQIWCKEECYPYVTVSEKIWHSVQNMNFQLVVPVDSAKPAL